MKKSFILFLLVIAVLGLIPVTSGAQELHQDDQGLYRAEVVRVLEEGSREVPGTVVVTDYQLIEARFLEGPQAGEVVILDNDLLHLREGNKFFVYHMRTIDGQDLYTVAEPDRRGWMLALVLLFCASVLWLSGWQGVRALISLAASFFIIIYFLLPQILAGTSPVLVSAVVSIIILALAIYFTHGLNRESTAALLGTAIAITATAALAYLSVYLVHLTGFVGDEATYLNINTGGLLDFRGLLLGAIIIGVVGVLDDIAITQAATVSELHQSAPQLSRLEVYQKALRVGREHVGALVNTLVFAYTGAALPLLLLFSMSTTDPTLILNREVFATEIVRTIVGSMGLIMTVPLTTWIATWLLYGKIKPGRPKVGHHHGHSH